MFLFKRLFFYLYLYWGYVSNCFAEAMSFRLHFVLLIVMDIFFYLSALATVYILFDHVEHIGPWNREQFLFFISIMLAINQLTMTFISESYWQFPLHIRTGELDFILVKPVNAVFAVFFRHIRPGSMMNIVFTWSAIIYFGIQIDLGPLAWVFLPFLVLLGFFLQNSIEIVLSCGMFWMLEGTGLNFVRIEMQQLSRWPDFIYHGIIRRVLSSLIPLLLIGSAPVRFLYEFSDILPLLAMIITIIIFNLILKFTWAAGLRTYESASS